MNEIEALQAELNGSIAEFKAIGEKLTDPNYEATADERSRFDELDRAIAAGQEKIEAIRTKMETDSERSARLNRLKEVKGWEEKIKEAHFRTPNDNGLYRGADFDNDYNAALACWARIGENGEAPDEREVMAMKRLGVNSASDNFKITDPRVQKSYARHLKNHYDAMASKGLTKATVEVNDEFMASAETDAWDSRVPDRAGYLNRMPEVLATLETNMVSYGGILQAPVTIMVTPHYEDVEETYTDDESRAGRQIGESSTIGTTKTPKVKKIVWKAYDFTSDDILVNNRQLMRSRNNLPPHISKLLGMRLGRAFATAFTTGTGANNPMGIVTAIVAATSYLETAASTTFAYDDLVNLETGLLDPFYWEFRPGIAFAGHPRMLNLLRKLTTGTGEEKLKIGREDNTGRKTVFEKPIYWLNEMQGPAASTYALTAGHYFLLYGDFSQFVIRRAGGGTLELNRGVEMIVDETTNRRTRQTIYTALMTVDSQIRNYGTAPLGALKVKA